MWPFKRKIVTLKESGIFDEFTDWHSHILPGVDDGVKTLEESLEVLKAYEDLGIKKIWLTPHIMEDYPNTPQELKKKFEELKANYDGDIELRLAAENMLDSLFEERLESDLLLPIGEEGNHVLVVTSYYTPPHGMDDMLEKLRKKGYFAILAHPERYRYMDQKDYEQYKEMGLLFQMNFLSLVGGYGETAQKKAEWLLSKGMVDVIGSDIHNLPSVMSKILESPKNNTIVDHLLVVSRQSGIA